MEPAKTSRDLAHEKEIAARRAVEYVRDGMSVGLGTGTTARFVIEELGRRVREGLRVSTAASSLATEELARSCGIQVTPFEQLSRLDIAIDGADEIDSAFHAVKGGGGALLREKVIAASADLMIAVVDSTKVVPKIGKFKVPVEVLPFALGFVENVTGALGASVVRRQRPDGAPFLTDQNNAILDLTFSNGYDAVSLARSLDATPGVMEHGLFLEEIDVLVVGDGDSVNVKQRKS